MINIKVSVVHADWENYRKQLRRIREIVFIEEQSVPKEEEWDGYDSESWHYLAITETKKPIGCARLMQSGQIGRMAVLKQKRGIGVGALLLNSAVSHARELKMNPIFLHAQTHAIEFYEKAGFIAHGSEFMDANIPHYAMTLSSDH